ncbi:methyltransferase regulatory domain-containing protein [Caulobacter segnis]
MSTDWSGGYAVETGYTYHVYPEHQSRPRGPAAAAERAAGPADPDGVRAGLRPGLFGGRACGDAARRRLVGLRLRPAHAVFARDLVEASGARANFTDDSVRGIRRPAGPAGLRLHQPARHLELDQRRGPGGVIAFLRKKPKPGGVVYLSYNSQPGWALAAPLRHLMKRHVDTPGRAWAWGRPPIWSRRWRRCSGSSPWTWIFARLNPAVGERLQGLMRQDRTYLVHEYMNDHWTPMRFAEVEALLAAAKLSFGTSAWMADHLEGLNLSGDMAAFLRDPARSASLRETFRDVAVQAQFRRDYRGYAGRGR